MFKAIDILFLNVQYNAEVNLSLKGLLYCFQYVLKSLEITGIVLYERMSKTARKKSKRLKSYKFVV